MSGSVSPPMQPSDSSAQPPYGGAPMNPPYGGPTMAPPPAAGAGSGVSKVLSIVAVILAVIALIANFAIPGPAGVPGAPGTNGTNGTNGTTGPRGLTGPQGPAGPGTLMNTSSTSATTTILSTCTNYAGGDVSITVPSSGTVFVTAQLWVEVSHTAGTKDLGFVNIGATDTDCASGRWTWPVEVAAVAGTGTYNVGTAPQRGFVVTAGTHTFYLNGEMNLGQDVNDVFWFANMVAVFYPS